MVRGRASQPKNMIPPLPIELIVEPIWERQPGELDHWFEIFSCYYLVLPGTKRTLARTYRESGPHKHKDVPENWKLAHRIFQWEDRARAYWESESDRFRNSIRESYTSLSEKIVDVATKSISKAEKIADYPLTKQTITKRDINGNAQQIIIEPNGSWSHRDAAVILKNTVSTLETASKGDDINRAIELLTKYGYMVVEESAIAQIEPSADLGDELD
jgi:hypothetical protein